MFQCSITIADYGMPTPHERNLNYKFFCAPCGEFNVFNVMFSFKESYFTYGVKM